MAGLPGSESGGPRRSAASDGCLSAEGTSLPDSVGSHSIGEGRTGVPGRTGRRFMASLQRAHFQKTPVVSLLLATCLSAAAFVHTKKEYRLTPPPNPHHFPTHATPP